MRIKTLPLGHLETNCYIVTDETTLECAAIDPGDESNTVMNYLEDHHLTLRAILLTHGHFDHTGAVNALLEETGAELYLHEKEAADVSNEHYRFFAPDGAKYYREGDTVQVGTLTFTVMETPGHTPGSVTLLCGPALFTGDTLFKDSAGRTDLPGGDMETEMASLRRLAALEGNYEVYPGHMDGTTLERERSVNYYMRYAVEHP